MTQIASWTSYCSSGDKCTRYGVRTVVTENSYSTANNTSNVTVTFYLGGAGALGLDTDYTGSSFYGYTCTGTIYVDGTKKVSTSSTPTINNNTKVVLATWTGDVEHDDNGKLSIPIKGVFSGGTSTQATAGTVSGTATFTTIPRASSMSFGTGTIGSALTLSITRKSSSFTHKITYTFGSLSGTITSSAGTSYSWTIPTTFYAQIPNAKYGTGTLTLTTYDGSTQIGDSVSYTFYAYCNETDCTPTISGTIEDTNETTLALTEDSSYLVDNQSIAVINLEYSAKNSASISKLYINGTQQTLGTKYTLVPSKDSYVIKITDTRGYSAEMTFQSTDSSDSNYFRRIRYINLTISSSTIRPTQTGSEMQTTISGNYFDGTFQSDAEEFYNTLAISWKVREKGTTTYTTGETEIVPTITDSAYEITNLALANPLDENGEWDYQKNYEFVFTATDRLLTVNITEIRTKGQPNFAIFPNCVTLPSGNLILDYEVLDEWDD